MCIVPFNAIANFIQLQWMFKKKKDEKVKLPLYLRFPLQIPSCKYRHNPILVNLMKSYLSKKTNGIIFEMPFPPYSAASPIV